MRSTIHTATTHAPDRPGLALAPATAAIGRSGDANVTALLAELSWTAPERDPGRHAYIWQRIIAADVAAGQGQR